jgi:membrane-bound lytic murein transglycosylase B
MRYTKIVPLIASLFAISGCIQKVEEPKKNVQIIEQVPRYGYEVVDRRPVITTRPPIIVESTPVVEATPIPPISPSALPAHTPPYNLNSIRSSYLGGAYANNYKLKKFINQMISKHHFNRAYLYGVFSSVQRDVKALTKYNVIGKRSKKVSAKHTTPGEWDRHRANFFPDRIGKGVNFWKQNQYYLNKAHREYGVAPEYIVAIIGVETNFGAYTGKHKILNALTSLSLEYTKRSKFFTTQLENLLLLTREQKLDPRAILGSYGGAFGLAQFMPDSFRTYTVDHDRSGQINLFTKADAIGSVANFFKEKGGWNPNIPVAMRVNYNGTRFHGAKTGYKTEYSQAKMRALGMTPTSNFFGYQGPVMLVKLNRYTKDEMWWGTPNLYAIARYNPREFYIMAVHQLAQAIRYNYYRR